MGGYIMTKHEAAVMTAFTGILIGSFSDFHDYTEKLLCMPIFTHQFGSSSFAKEIKEASRTDFIAINENITDT
jgi:hypothetical protein